MSQYKNPGKLFEQHFMDSGRQQGLYVYRIKDQYVYYQKNKVQSDQYLLGSDDPISTNVCDCFVMSKGDNGGILFALELKSTMGTSISIQNDINNKNQGMIKLHQVQSLNNISLFEHNVVAGFVFNFRSEKMDTEYTYFMRIDDFSKWYEQTNKSSINKIDIVEFGGRLIANEKKRKYFYYDVERFTEEERDRYFKGRLKDNLK